MDSPLKAKPSFSRKQSIWVLVVLLLVLFLVWMFFQNSNGSEDLGTVIRPDLQREIGVENAEQISSAIREIKEENLPRDSILQIKLLEERIIGSRVLGLSEILEIFSPEMPEAVKNNLGGEFMLGIYTDGAEGSVFLITKVTSPAETRAGLRDWESFILEDLSGLFSFQNVPTQDTEFRNELVRNQAVREALRSNGAPYLLYSFWREDTLFITTNKDAFRKVFDVFMITRR